MAQLFGLLLLCALLPAMAGDARNGSAPVRIHAPVAGAFLDTKIRHRLDYEIAPGAGGHHVHVYVDDIEVAILRALKGNHLLPKLKAGGHEICVKVVNAKHVPIGLENCVRVNVR